MLLSHATELLSHAPGRAGAMLFHDVPADELAREDAYEQRRGALAQGATWQSYLRRVLPALEQHSADGMASALLAAGQHPLTARAHAATMRRRAIAAGDTNGVQFWGAVTVALEPGPERHAGG